MDYFFEFAKNSLFARIKTAAVREPGEQQLNSRLLNDCSSCIIMRGTLVACVHACVLAVLFGGAKAFLPAPVPFAQQSARRMAAGGPPLQCVIVTRMCSEPVGEPGGTARRQATRLVASTSSALLAGAALPAPCRAFFGIGEPFTVFEEEEDGAQEGEYPVYGSREIMKKKKHGTSDKPVMKNLKFGCDYELADKICNFNRHFAENAGYFKKTRWLSEVDGEETTYYDRSRIPPPASGVCAEKCTRCAALACELEGQRCMACRRQAICLRL
jgi:hypothetical protein